MPSAPTPPQSGHPRPRAGNVRLGVFAVVICALIGPAAVSASQTVIHVDDDAAPGGTGTNKAPYRNLPEAVAAANGAVGNVVIKVAPGSYGFAETLVIKRSMELRGSTEQAAGDDHWPSGEIVTGTATRLFSTNPALAQLILVARPDRTVIHDVTVRGFVVQSSATTISLLLNRVQDYWIADNVFRAPGSFGMQSVASSGRVTGNHFSGVTTGAILTGGYPASPSNVVFSGNRAVRNNLGGLLLNGASIRIPELGDRLNAIVRDNDLSENIDPGQGFGFRIFILRRDPGAPGDSQSSASVQADVRDNRIHGNRTGIVLDAGFPYRRFGAVCDARVYSGSIELQLTANTLTGSLQAPALITFTRNQAAMDQSLLPDWQYLHDSMYTISDADGTLAGAVIDHPASDPYIGTCPGDSSNELLENVLTYNDVVLAPSL